MARPKTKRRGFRPITVDNRSYSWRLNTISGLIEVNLAEAHTQRLEVSFGWYDSWLYKPGEERPPDFEPRIVMPRFIEAVIRSGLKAGWNPDVAAPAMRLIYKDNVFCVAE